MQAIDNLIGNVQRAVNYAETLFFQGAQRLVLQGGMATVRQALNLMVQSAEQLAASSTAHVEALIQSPAVGGSNGGGVAGSGWSFAPNPNAGVESRPQDAGRAFFEQGPPIAPNTMLELSRSIPPAVVRQQVAHPSSILLQDDSLARPPIQRSQSRPSDSGDAGSGSSTAASGTWSSNSGIVLPSARHDLQFLPEAAVLPHTPVRRALMPLNTVGELDYSPEEGDDERSRTSQRAPGASSSFSIVGGGNVTYDNGASTSSSSTLAVASAAVAAHEPAYTYPAARLSHTNSTNSSNSTIDLEDHLGDLRSPGDFRQGNASTSYKRHATALSDGGSFSQEPTPTKNLMLLPRSASSASAPPNVDDLIITGSTSRTRRGRPPKKVAADERNSSPKRASTRRRGKGKSARTQKSNTVSLMSDGDDELDY